MRFDSGHSSKGIFELWAWILMLKIGILIPSYKYPKQEQKRYQMEQSLWFCGTERYLHRICVIPRQYCNCDEHHDGHRHWHSYHPHGQWPAIIIIFMIVISCYKEDWDDKTVGGLPRPIMGHTAHTSCLLIIIINHQGGILDDHSWWLAIVSIRNKWDRYKMKGHSLQSSVLLVKHTKEDISCQVSVQSRPVVHVCVHRIFTRACLREGMSMRKGSGRGNSITFGMTLLEMPLRILNAVAFPLCSHILKCICARFRAYLCILMHRSVLLWWRDLPVYNNMF